MITFGKTQRVYGGTLTQIRRNDRPVGSIIGRKNKRFRNMTDYEVVVHDQRIGESNCLADAKDIARRLGDGTRD